MPAMRKHKTYLKPLTTIAVKRHAHRLLLITWVDDQHRVISCSPLNLSITRVPLRTMPFVLHEAHLPSTMLRFARSPDESTRRGEPSRHRVHPRTHNTTTRQQHPRER